MNKEGYLQIQGDAKFAHGTFKVNRATGEYEKMIQIQNLDAESFNPSYVIGLEGDLAELMWCRAHELYQSQKADYSVDTLECKRCLVVNLKKEVGWRFCPDCGRPL